MSTENGNSDATGGSGSSTMTNPAPATGKSRAKKHTLRLPGMPPLGLSTSTPLVGTPYASSHAPPFEYPFPSSSAAAAPSQHVPLYIPSLESPSHSPFPFAPILMSGGNGYPFGQGKMQSLGLGLPIWKRSSSPPHPKFMPSRVDPPVPPRLKDRLKDKVQSTGGVTAGETDGEEKQSKAFDMDGGNSCGDAAHELDTAPNRDDVAERETARPESPEVT